MKWAFICVGASLVAACGPSGGDDVPLATGPQESRLRLCGPQSREGRACDDGNPCTFGDVCTSRVCAGIPYSCDDGNVCTDDACDGAGGCAHLANVSACDDGRACTSADVCAAGTCGGTPGVETCRNGTDDDCDGLVDAADPECAPACGDGIREGGEQCDGADLGEGTCAALGYSGGTLSCSDTCTFVTSGCTSTCPPECVCIDGDGDGWSGTGGTCGPVDCDDTVPSRNPGAQEECDNGFDDDCDGLVDADDAVDCPPCAAVETLCADGLDEDCDMLADCADPDCAPQCVAGMGAQKR